MKKILLISNRVMHYRVSIYNYFYSEFQNDNIEFIVRTCEVQKQNENRILFDCKEIDFTFHNYKNEINKIKPDAVILFLHLKEKLYWSLIHFLKINRIPVIYWNKAKNYDKPNNIIKNALFRYMHNLADRIILYGRHEKKYISRKNLKKVFIANNTVNYLDYPEIKQTKEEIKKEYNVDYGKIVLFAGRIGVGKDRKKLSHLIKVFQEIENKRFGLIIVGSGMNDNLKKECIGRNIKYLGEVHDPENVQIGKVFKMADIFCIPGHLGLSVVQAFFNGLPVVTEYGLQPPEIKYVKDGRNGFIVPENNTQELKNKLLYLLENKEILKEFSENCKKDIFKHASIENMFLGFKNCIESLF